jgi:hypothetical protein
MKKKIDPQSLSGILRKLIENFEKELRSSDLRKKVVALIPILHELRRIGKNLIPTQTAASARDRILHYFRKYPLVVISGDELFVVSGIQEYARRVRELRVQFGWAIINGVTAKTMAEEGELPDLFINVKKMGPDDYVLLSAKEDKEAAYRWNLANEIRRKKVGVRDKILEFFRKNVGKQISGEELRYLAKDKTEWARRVRELRTEFGWPISTKNTGRPDLGVGVYLLESNRQSPEHDRQIPDPVRAAVLRRDKYKCKSCSWTHKEWNPSDARHLELHHVKEHAKGGANTEDNLMTVCTVCHDEIHRRR